MKYPGLRAREGRVRPGPRSKIIGLALLVLTLTLVLALPGCTNKKTSSIRSLSPEEAAKLQKPQPERIEEEKDPIRLEADGDRLALSEQWPAALFQYNRALTLAEGENKYRLRSKIGRVYMKNGKWAQAEAAFLALTGERADDPVAWQGLGLARLAMGQRQGIEEPLKKALELNPDLWLAHNGLGILYNWRGELQQAVLSFGRALALKPDSPSIRNNLGLTFIMIGRLSLAEAAFKRALELNPNYKLAANNLALVYARQGRRAEALALFKDSVGQAQAHNNLGCLLSWQGRHLEAVEEFEKALQVMPTYYERADRHLATIKNQSLIKPQPQTK